MTTKNMVIHPLVKAVHPRGDQGKLHGARHVHLKIGESPLQCMGGFFIKTDVSNEICCGNYAGHVMPP